MKVALKKAANEAISSQSILHATPINAIVCLCSRRTTCNNTSFTHPPAPAIADKLHHFPRWKCFYAQTYWKQLKSESLESYHPTNTHRTSIHFVVNCGNKFSFLVFLTHLWHIKISLIWKGESFLLLLCFFPSIWFLAKGLGMRPGHLDHS